MDRTLHTDFAKSKTTFPYQNFSNFTNRKGMISHQIVYSTVPNKRTYLNNHTYQNILKI